MKVDEVQALGTEIRNEIAKAVVGQEATVDLMLVALFAGGHMLLEGPPGTAKTLLAHSFAQAIGLDFGRIQFTPDLMPADIIGANLFNFQTSSFSLTRGPIFTELLLADEINRTPPKTQAALLEAMQERQVTIDGQSHRARRPVHGRRDPESDRAARRLSAARSAARPIPVQADRRLSLARGREEDHRHPRREEGDDGAFDLGRRAQGELKQIAAAMTAVNEIRLVDEVIDYVAALVRGTRENPDLESGASPRAGAMLAGAARSRAAIDGRDFVIPDDVKVLAAPLLRHRVILSPAAEINGRKIEEIVTTIIEAIEAPR